MRTFCLAAVAFLSAHPILFSADMHVRFARLALAEGKVEVEAPVTGERIPAERNLPVGQGFWVETGDESRTEIEFDDGNVIRLGPASLAELSDLARLSTGQRISLVSLERGTLYVTAEPLGLDAFLVVAPGLQITFVQGARVRLHVGADTTTVAILEGRVRFSSPAAELELDEGQTVRVDPKAEDRFQLFREVAAAPLDEWSEQRDREAGARAAGSKLAVFQFGSGELDANGKWIEAAPWGKVWQPRTPQGWAPFRSGQWRWYEPAGYTWVSSEPWGWLPYHYGRWATISPHGWVWVPGGSGSFHPGETYWLRSAALVGWGPLAPGEEWRAEGAPLLYSAANTTFAVYQDGARLLTPVGTPSAPRNPLAAGQFVAALPSPPPAPVLAARKRTTRVGTTRILPVTADQAYGAARQQGTESAVQAPGGIRIIGAEPPAPEPPPPAPASSGYYYYSTVPGPEAAPSAGYSPGGVVYVPEVVVIERDRPRPDRRDQGGWGGWRNKPPGAAPAAPPKASSPPAPAAPGVTTPAAPPPPKSEAPGSEGREHKGRLRSPEGSDASKRRQ